MTKTQITSLYERLSHDDKLNGATNSVSNQKSMLEDNARRNGFPTPPHFTDDGISGTPFDHPAMTLDGYCADSFQQDQQGNHE